MVSTTRNAVARRAVKGKGKSQLLRKQQNQKHCDVIANVVQNRVKGIASRKTLGDESVAEYDSNFIFTNAKTSRAIEVLRLLYNADIEQHYTPTGDPKVKSSHVAFQCTRDGWTIDNAKMTYEKRRKVLCQYYQNKVQKHEGTVYEIISTKDRTSTTIYHVPDQHSMSAEEINCAKKQLATMDVVAGAQAESRTFKMENTIVYFPRLATPQVIVVRNHLSRAALAGQFLLSLLHIKVSKGWMTGCMASGPLTEESFRRNFNLGYPLNSWGTEKEKVVKVSITSTLGSGRCYYHNDKGRQKSFQVGGFLDREVSENPLKRYEKLARENGKEKYIPYLRRYYEEVYGAFMKYAPYLVSDETKTAMSDDPNLTRDLLTAVNLQDARNSRLHIHTDKPSFYPALITGLNPAGQFRKWDGGELLMVQGGVIVKYGCRDVVLLNGSQLHGVLPLRPKKNVKCATRVSMVHFSRRCHDDEHYGNATLMEQPHEVPTC